MFRGRCSAHNPTSPDVQASGAAFARRGPPTASTRITAVTAVPGPLVASTVFEPGHMVGRFTVLEYLGAGAMGIVYAAYDPQLDRKVALKVLSRRFAARRSGDVVLHREAQAMAKLSHPNVAVVHDIGVHDGVIFIAMEFVPGVTLQAWLSQRPRAWSEIVEVFSQAGRGLAAAHAAGLVHRDFKPSNAMIADGRVRVLDFGLCCSPSEAGPEVVGTPAYMPPEQFLGEPIGPASDQFSFCASLYQALYGQYPFAGESPEELCAAITGGELRSPPRAARVPAWVGAAVVRGLQHDPRARFATMEELLRALDHRRARARMSLIATVACVVVSGVGGYLSAGGAEPAACSGGADEIAEVWNEQRRGEIAGVFAGLPGELGRELGPRVDRELDGHARRWQAEHRHACEARRRGENSDALLDRRMACLERSKTALDEAVRVLADADRDVALRSLQVVRGLPSPSRCADLEALADAPAPPSDPRLRTARELLRVNLERIRTLHDAGRSAQAVALADTTVAGAREQGDPPTLAEALLRRARLTLNFSHEQDPVDKDALLTEALRSALASRSDELAVEALILRMYLRGRTTGQLPRALDDLTLADALLSRVRAPGRLRGLLLNNAGSVYLAGGQPERAAALFREALAVRKAALGPNDIEVGFTLTNLAMLVPDPGEREALFERALAIFESELGAAHPETVELRIAVGAYTQDPFEAIAVLEHGCAAVESLAPDHFAPRALCLFQLGRHAHEAGQPGLAGDAFARALALAGDDAASGSELDPTDVALIRGYAGLLTGSQTAAAFELRGALGRFETSDEWWSTWQRAELELCLGLNLLAQGAATAAREALARALAGFVRVGERAGDVALPRRLALTRLALAEALLADHAPADEFLDAAESWYRDAGDGFAWRLAAIAELRRSSSPRMSGPP
jgi:tetratricopeptide (TPR) repeat protein/predicted Ser/Thr protein kinase